MLKSKHMNANYNVVLAYGAAPMTPPPTPKKSKKTKKTSKSMHMSHWDKNRERRARGKKRKHERKKHTTNTENKATGRYTACDSKNTTNVAMLGMSQETNTMEEDGSKVPWFVDPQYKDLSFSSVADDSFYTQDPDTVHAFANNQSDIEKLSRSHQLQPLASKNYEYGSEESEDDNIDKELPWFVHPQYRNLSFSSTNDSDNRYINDEEAICTSSNANEVKTESIPRRIPPPKPVRHMSADSDSEESHENNLEKLLSSIPSAETFHTQQAPAPFDAESGLLLSPSVIETMDNAYFFVRSMSREGSLLMRRAGELERKLRRKNHDGKKKKRYEEGFRLTVELASELLIQEYAFRNRLDKRLGSGLKSEVEALMYGVGSVVEGFDEGMEKLREERRERRERKYMKRKESRKGQAIDD